MSDIDNGKSRVDLQFIRRLMKPIVHYDSPAYRFAAHAVTQYVVLRREGWQMLQRLNHLGSSTGAETLLNMRSLASPIIIRPGTDDILSIINNAIREEYGQFEESFKPTTIVDVGAYIGDTCAYFLTRFPSARVIALEPNDESHTLAAKNLAPYGARASLLKFALWTESSKVRFGGVQTSAAIGASGTEVQTTTIPLLMEQFDLDFIDLLKIDIEGAESQVIPSGVGGWLNRIGTLLLETHGAQIEAALIPLLEGNGFTCRRFRNVWYCRARSAPG